MSFSVEFRKLTCPKNVLLCVGWLTYTSQWHNIANMCHLTRPWALQMQQWKLSIQQLSSDNMWILWSSLIRSSEDWSKSIHERTTEQTLSWVTCLCQCSVFKSSEEETRWAEVQCVIRRKLKQEQILRLHQKIRKPCLFVTFFWSDSQWAKGVQMSGTVSDDTDSPQCLLLTVREKTTLTLKEWGQQLRLKAFS